MIDQGVNLVSTDVVIIGAGIGGFSAAIEAMNLGIDVILVDKGRKAGFHGSSCTSGGGMSVLLPAEDYVKEATDVGAGLNVSELIETVAYESKKVIEKLSMIGIPFTKTSTGQKVPGEGPALMLALRKETLHRGVRVFENMLVHDLLLDPDEGSVAGCIGIGTLDGCHTVIRAKAVVLAAGSATGLFPYSTANYLTTGDGYWLAYNAGAEFINMEFTEFSIMPAPNGIPLKTGGIKPLIRSGAVKFFNALGEQFLGEHDVGQKELTDRSKLVSALYSEIKAGRGPVYMDITGLPEEQFYEFEEINQLDIIRKLQHIGVDYRRDRFQWISPAIHAFLGGVRINREAKTNISGLFAVGENAGGIYGAARLGSYLTAASLFGFIAGAGAAKHSIARDFSRIDQDSVSKIVQKISHRGGKGSSIHRIKEKLRNTSAEYLGVDRNEQGLTRAIEQFNSIMDTELGNVVSSEGNMTNLIVRLIEARNLALTGKLVAKAALSRKETRGHHRRSDFPVSDGNWRKWVIMEKGKDDVKVRFESLAGPVLEA